MNGRKSDRNIQTEACVYVQEKHELVFCRIDKYIFIRINVAILGYITGQLYWLFTEVIVIKPNLFNLKQVDPW